MMIVEDRGQMSMVIVEDGTNDDSGRWDRW